MAHNPYEAPGSLSERHVDADASDLFVQTLPSPLLKLAGLTSLVAGGIDLFLVLQFLLAMSAAGARPGLALEVILAVLSLCGVLYFIVAWGIVNGKLPLLIAGLFVAFLSLLASMASLLFVLSLAALGSVGLGMSNLGLLLLNVRNVQRISAAYRALRADTSRAS